MEDIFRDFFEFTEAKGIPVVLAAGNNIKQKLHQGVPQKFGTDGNGIITVGGVKQDGSLWEDTAPAIPGEDGSMTVFAPAVDIIVPGNGGDLHVGTSLNKGTSQAAAITVSPWPFGPY
jgi:hypothetical protein